jgi:hypothetical protein
VVEYCLIFQFIRYSRLYDVRALSLLEQISHLENREVFTFKNPAKAEIVVYKTRKFTDVFYP